MFRKRAQGFTKRPETSWVRNMSPPGMKRETTEPFHLQGAPAPHPTFPTSTLCRGRKPPGLWRCSPQEPHVPSSILSHLARRARTTPTLRSSGGLPVPQWERRRISRARPRVDPEKPNTCFPPWTGPHPWQNMDSLLSLSCQSGETEVKPLIQGLGQALNGFDPQLNRTFRQKAWTTP